MNLFLIEMGTYKVYFDVETTEEEAREIIAQHDPTSEVHNFYSKREIGCNTVTFAVITSSLEKMRVIEQDGIVTKIELISSFQSAGDCCGEDAPKTAKPKKRH